MIQIIAQLSITVVKSLGKILFIVSGMQYRAFLGAIRHLDFFQKATVLPYPFQQFYTAAVDEKAQQFFVVVLFLAAQFFYIERIVQIFQHSPTIFFPNRFVFCGI